MTVTFVQSNDLRWFSDGAWEETLSAFDPLVVLRTVLYCGRRNIGRELRVSHRNNDDEDLGLQWMTVEEERESISFW